MTRALFPWAFLLLASMYAQTAQEAKHKPNEVLVKFRGGAVSATASARQLEKALDVVETRRVGRTGVMLLRSRTKDTETLIRELKARSDVIYAEPNVILHLSAVPNDPRFGELWGLSNTGQVVTDWNGVPWQGTAGADVDAPAAWNISIGSRGSVVAVLDSGIDASHPDIVPNLWSASRSYTVQVGNDTITCPADSHGFDVVNGDCEPGDDNKHGTFVAGILGAAGGNGAGVAGVNWSTRIMAVKMAYANGGVDAANAANAIDYVLQAQAEFGSETNIRILSASWGGTQYSQAILDAIQDANAVGMLFVTVAGNYGQNIDEWPFYPASYGLSNIVAVAATDNRDQLAAMPGSVTSSYGPTSVHLGAPGWQILSTVPPGLDPTCGVGSYCYGTGTSAAAPYVSGTAALVLSACPNLTLANLKSAILNNVDYIPALSGITITGGRLNAYQAVQSCASQCAFGASPLSPSFSYQSGSGTVSVFAAAGCPWTASENADWLTITSGTSGSGNGTVYYSVAANPNPRTRSTLLAVAGKPVTVTQDPAPYPDLTIGASATGSFVRGQPSAYTVTVTNTGGAATSGAVTVSHTLSSGMTPAALYGSGWTCNPATLTCTRSDSLAVNTSYPPLTIAVNVNWNAPASVADTATVSGGGDADASNNSATATVAVGSLLPNLILQNFTLSIGAYVYQAPSDITAQSAFNIESGASATFASGGTIHLEPGFWAKTGSGFHAVIDPTIQ